MQSLSPCCFWNSLTLYWIPNLIPQAGSLFRDPEYSFLPGIWNMPAGKTQQNLSEWMKPSHSILGPVWRIDSRVFIAATRGKHGLRFARSDRVCSHLDVYTRNPNKQKSLWSSDPSGVGTPCNAIQYVGSFHPHLLTQRIQEAFTQQQHMFTSPHCTYVFKPFPQSRIFPRPFSHCRLFSACKIHYIFPQCWSTAPVSLGCCFNLVVTRHVLFSDGGRREQGLSVLPSSPAMKRAIPLPTGKHQ